ncbi:LacI family DNA-binding transcriptional regulator [Roseibium suaedae]|uniref:Transcriptional regulator, LacI family n=1 Tax=Roseibium suaedae TaxID=735517 RepID=A0A1M7NVI8_9HYPH|nr:LacI family DNA-binding transcriptional regulator [Roseibium suaedae]SHN07750.1 transcriptional regulator, LacI family [Roseibium suaedae]
MADDMTAHSFDDVVRIEEETSSSQTGRSKPVRIEEVARLADVSPITVSRALRNPDLVSEKTRKRILEVVQETGYWSNPHASALRSGRSSIVAVFVSNLLSQQYTRAAQACAQVIEANGLQMMVGQTSYSYSRELTAIQSLRALRPAAVFLTGVIELEENRRMLRDLNIPIVESWAHTRDPIDMLVAFSNVDAGRLAATHLANRGFKRPAFIGRGGGRGKLRLQGFTERLSQRDLPLTGSVVVDQVESIENGRSAYRKLQESGVSFDSVFCANDLLGIGAMIEAGAQGQRIPEDVGILGFGDRSDLAALSPRLSLVGVDTSQIGRQAGEMILSRLNGEEAPERLCVDLSLLQGVTT